MSVFAEIPQAELEAMCEEMLAGLLPEGLAWPRPLSPDLARVVEAMAAELARVKGRARALLREMDPRQTAELLEDWERITGLPDPCLVDGSPSSPERRANLVAHLNRVSSQSVAAYVELAAGIGYEITVEEYTRFEVGRNGAGEQVGGEAWQFHWTIHAPKITPTFFAVGESAVGEPLASWGDQRLECFMQRAKPAHTTIDFVYDLTWLGYAPWGRYLCPKPALLRLRAKNQHSVNQ